MTGAEPRPRFAAPVDVHLILRRSSPGGDEVLLSRRAGSVYASGLLHLPSGHVDGAHEDVVDAVIREAREETGVLIDRADVRAAVTVHHRSPAGGARIGFFLEAVRWQGTPEIREPQLCSEMSWVPLDALPDDMVAYCRAGLDAYRHGGGTTVHFQQPDDPIAFDRGADRLQLLPAAEDRGAGLEAGLRAFAEQAVGRLAVVAYASWLREGSRVWRLTGIGGGTWFLKQHRSARFHQREVGAYREWVGTLGARAPRLVAVDAEQGAVVITALEGRSLHGLSLDPAREREVRRRLGALTADFHHGAPSRPALERGPSPADKLERHLAVARSFLADGDEERLHATARRYAALGPAELVPTHGDLQYRNVLLGDGDEVSVVDFERAEYATATRDLVRLSDVWDGRPDLREAFLAGYGRPFTAVEEERMECEAAFDALSGLGYGHTHGDPEVAERGQRTLARLRKNPRS
ncbi:NUDIX domain-containing protein [Streptomyces sp. NBC_01210]|uniref:phosphotransferase n=1 Tax=Streptomyces sp. NBC_01210 TaxID=2903774 RepID=UPI002E0EEEC7|nr:NUDIX domain-containing protein [Streptomyces sp. NBC_01210]